MKFDAYAIGDDQAFAPPQPGAAGAKPVATWTEALVFKKRASTHRSPKNVADELPHHFEADWIVGVESTKKAVPATTHYVVFTVRVGRVVSETYFRLPGFAVTTEPKLHEIMLHEFSKPAADPKMLPLFDAVPLENILTSLTVQQRRILANTGLGTKRQKQRLVVLITLQGTKRDRPMYADTCEKGSRNRSVFANASFSVFHCRSKGDQVSLVMHTEFFCVNTRNAETNAFFRSNGTITGEAGAAFRYVFVAWQTPHHEAVYHLVCTPSGQSIMGSNSMHGQINTIGCWMLFRNYNWPLKDDRGQDGARAHFQGAYIAWRSAATERGVATQALLDTLKLHGYDKPKTGANEPASGSAEKYISYDRNYAYSYFLDRVLGFRFNSAFEDKDAEKAGVPVHTNMHQTTGTFSASFERSKAHSGSSYHRLDDVIQSDWVASDLGFKTAAKAWYGNAPKTDDPPAATAAIAALSWADVYFFVVPGKTGAAVMNDSVAP